MHILSPDSCLDNLTLGPLYYSVDRVILVALVTSICEPNSLLDGMHSLLSKSHSLANLQWEKTSGQARIAADGLQITKSSNGTTGDWRSTGITHTETSRYWSSILDQRDVQYMSDEECNCGPGSC